MRHNYRTRFARVSRSFRQEFAAIARRSVREAVDCVQDHWTWMREELREARS